MPKIYLNSDMEEKKSELTILNDRPLSAETPPHLLDDEVTPTHRLFVRNNGIVPSIAYQKNTQSERLFCA